MLCKRGRDRQRASKASKNPCKNVLLALPVDDTLERRRTVSLEVSLFSLLLSLLRVTLGGTGAGMGGRGGLSDRTEMVKRQ